MLVQLRHQANSVLPNNPGGFIAVFVIFESVVDRDPGHSHINAGLERIASRIKTQDRGMFGNRIVQENHVNAMVERLFRRLA